MDDFSSLYLRRKLGEGMGRRYVTASLSPGLLLFLVTAALAFSLTFISSVSATIDRMLQVLGSGSVLCREKPDEALLPRGSQVDKVSQGEGLCYSGTAVRAVLLKGVGEDYFRGMRGEELSLELTGDDALNPVILSSALSDGLSLAPGDRFTLLVYDEEKERTRPALCTVKGIFKSVYPQLDSRLMYVPSSLLPEEESYEILLPPGFDAEKTAMALGRGLSYRTLYRPLYANLQSSVAVLYVIFLSVSLLAAFFSSDIAETYIVRDRKDIAHLLLMGLDEKDVRKIYLRLTLAVSGLSSVTGTALGLCLSLFSPVIVSLMGDSPVLEYYVLSFSLSVPWAGISLMLILMFILSLSAVILKLRRAKLADVFLL